MLACWQARRYPTAFTFDGRPSKNACLRDMHRVCRARGTVLSWIISVLSRIISCLLRSCVHLTPIGAICCRVATHDFPPFLIVDKSELSQKCTLPLCVLCKPCPGKRLADLFGALCSQMRQSSLWNGSLWVHPSRLRQGWHHIQIGKSLDNKLNIKLLQPGCVLVSAGCHNCICASIV